MSCDTCDVIVMEVDWGDVATWFTGIVTAGTLAVAVLILWRDRKREERAQAAKIAIRVSRYEEGPVDTIDRDGNVVETPDRYVLSHQVRLWNYSDQPIFDVSIVDSRNPFTIVLTGPPEGALLPGKSLEYTHDDISSHDYLDVRVVFTDAASVQWVYDPRTSLTSKAWKHRRWFKKHSKVISDQFWKLGATWE